MDHLFGCVSRFTFAFAVLYCLFLVGWERTDLFALLFAMFPCDFITFPYGDLGQVCCLIESIHYLCLFLYFYDHTSFLMSFF